MADRNELPVSPIVQQLIGKLRSEVRNDLELGCGGKLGADLEALAHLLTTTYGVLEDAERMHSTSLAFHNCMKAVKDAVYDADDVVDELEVEALRLHHHRLRFPEKVCRFFPWMINSYIFRFRMAQKIKQIIKRFKELLDELRKFGYIREGAFSAGLQRVVEIDTIPYVNGREILPFVSVSQVYGRDEDKEILVNMLLNMDNDRDLSVIPIVGLGGTGKTTLAQSIYNDVRISNHFELRMWVFVGESFNVNDLASTIIACVGERMLDVSTIESMRQLIREKVLERRFLLVLDDVWNEDYEKWERIIFLFAGGRHGSKILVTTRSGMVAHITGTVVPYRIAALSDEACWNLFRERAFGLGGMEESPKLIDIGRQIVKNCGGSPLAAKALGCLMRTARTEEEWSAILNTEIWELSDGGLGIMPALRLSYEKFPSTLKLCFAYLSLFPSDYEIHRSKLIQLWTAEGFIPVSTREQLSAESVANNYINTLLSFSFFNVGEKDEFGRIVSFKIHDLIHDLACYISSSDFSFKRVGRTPRNCRYYSMILEPDTDKLMLYFDVETERLRSLHLFSKSPPSPVALEELCPMSSLKHLRVLSVSGLVNAVKFLNIVGRLKHLRFLDLSFSSFEVLPNSIASLYCLQSLCLQGCSELRQLPKDMGNLRSLRHFDISNCDKIIEMPLGLGRLTDLQTLSLFVVSEEQGQTISELRNLNLISGELTIRCLKNVKDPEEARAANLHEKAHILSLRLEWLSFNDDEDLSLIENGSEESLLQNLLPHPNLMHLAIKSYCGIRLPDWLGTMLPNLEKLQLNWFRRCNQLMWLGSTFPSLKILYMGNLPHLEEWIVPESGMLLLENLTIVRCPTLRVRPQLPSSVTQLQISESNEELLEAGGALKGLSNLSYLYIDHMTASSKWWTGLQYLTALEKLEITWCRQLECLPEGVFLVPSLRILMLHHIDNLKSLEDVRGRRPLFYEFLHHLSIEECAHLTELPDWIADLTSLHFLNIKWCKNLAMLPDGLQRLANLSQLTIVGCPLLDGRCEVDLGQDWQKIAHIPNIYIGKIE